MKPPWYEEMDHGRELAIPKAFAQICGDQDRYELIILPPVRHPHGWCGPLPRHSFHVQDKQSGELVAELHADGRYLCHRMDFQPFLDRMEGIVERAGQESYDRFMEMYQRSRQME